MSSPLSSLAAFYRSSIGKKTVVAVTGIALLLFLLGHMLGNLLIFVGKDALNLYAAKLKSLGPLLWVIRFGLLAIFVIHIVATVQLVIQNRAARGGRYRLERTQQATLASRFMIVSGSIVLIFVVYHILHFTVGAGNSYLSYQWFPPGSDTPVHDVHKMVVDGFSWLPAALFYIVAMALLCFHLAHGTSSVFQTLGLTTKRTWPLIEKLGYGYAALIFVGNSSIPLAVMLNFIQNS